MENNNQDQLPEEEIPNLEQFQVGRAPSADDDQLDEDMDDLSGTSNLSDDPDEEYDTEEVDDVDDTDDSEYTEDEIEYADGEGTLLDDEIEDDEEDEI